MTRQLALAILVIGMLAAVERIEAAAASDTGTKLRKALMSKKPIDAMTQEVSEILIELAGDPVSAGDAIADVIGTPDLPHIDLVHACVRVLKPSIREQVYVQMLMHKPSLSETTLEAVARELAETTHECASKELWGRVEAVQKSTLTMILAAQAFSRSRQKDLEKIALRWAQDVQTGDVQSSASMREELVRLLGEVGSTGCDEAILKLLGKFWPNSGSDLVTPICILGEHRYADSIRTLEQIAIEGDVAFPNVKVEALAALVRCGNSTDITPAIQRAAAAVRKGLECLPKENRAIYEEQVNAILQTASKPSTAAATSAGD